VKTWDLNDVCCRSVLDGTKTRVKSIPEITVGKVLVNKDGTEADFALCHGNRPILYQV